MIKKLLAVGMTAAIFLSAGSAVFAADGSAAEVVSPSGAVTAPAKSSRMTAASDFVIKNGVLTEYTGSGGNVVIPDTVTSIGDTVFFECTSLKSVTIPKSVISIGEGVFLECVKLEKIIVDSGNAYYSSVDGVLYNKDKTVLIKCPEGKKGKLMIPNTVVTISEVACADCKGLTEVTIPSSVRLIDRCAFADCKGLKTLNIYTSYPIVDIEAFTVGSEVDDYSTGPMRIDTVNYADEIGQWQISFSHALDVGKTLNLNCAAFDITSQPKSQTVNFGKKVTLSVKTNGSGLKYQWYFKKQGQKSFSKWNGRTHASETCTPNATWDGIQLYCIVKDSAGNKVQSNTVTVKVNSTGITITQQPQEQSIVAGTSITLTVQATGSSLKYQWYFKKKGQTSFNIWNGRTHATETVSPNNTWDGIQLYCKITDGSGKTLNSSTVTINVLSITTQPSNITVAAGSNATFKVVATGSGLKYQWQYKKSSQTSWSNWGARTTASTTATSNATWNGMQVRCIVTDSAGNKITSNAATITIK